MLDESIELSKRSLHKKDPISEAIEQLLAAETRLVSVEHDRGWRALLQFSSVQTALNAVGAFARKLIAAKRGGLPVRIGIATGESSSDGLEDTISQRAKWLASVAPLSGILTSQTTAAIAEDLDLFPSWLEEYGDLYNLAQVRKEQIFKFRDNALPDPPGLPDEEEPPNNIPIIEEYFIGRLAEIEDIHVLFSNNRWVSLIGPSGLGKSMLSWRMAHELLSGMRDGVRYVDLSGVTSREEVVSRLCGSIGLKVDHLGPISANTIRSYFGNRHHLILFDGCERCLPALAPIVKSLLATRGVQILTTSTQEFKMAEEGVIEIGTFGSPPSEERYYSVEQLEGYDATALFLDRYRIMRPDYEPTPEELGQIAQICQVLDGHPLGISLAVGMLRNETLARVLASVRQGYSGQNKSKRRKRHENLDAAVRWTVESLQPEACRLLETASVFEDLWSRDDLKEMMETEMPEVVKPLNELLETGMVVFDESVEAPECYRLLPHVRHAMRDSMKNNKDWPNIRQRHFFRIYQKFAKRLPDIKGANQAEHLDRLDMMRADFEAALRYLIETENSQDSFLMAMGQCWSYWYRRNRLSPVIALADAARTKCKPTEEVNRARLDMLAAIFETKNGDSDSAQKRLRRAWKIVADLDQPELKARLLTNLGLSLWADAEPAKACKVLKDAVAIARTTGNIAVIYPTVSTFVPPLLDLGRFDDAWDYLQELREISRDSKDPLVHWGYHLGLGEYYCEIGEQEKALESIASAIDKAQMIGDPSAIGRGYLWRAQSLLKAGHFEEAAEDLGRSLYLVSNGEQSFYKTNELRIIVIEGRLIEAITEPQVNLRKMYGALQSQLDTGKM